MKTFKQLSFTEKIRWRNRALWLAVILMLICMVLVGELGGGDSRIMTDLAQAVSRILYFGGLICIGRRIYLNKQLLQNKLLLKEKYLAEQDERNRSLYEKSGGLAMDLMLLCLMIAAFITSLYNMAAFHTSFALLIGGIVIKTGLYLLYSRRAS